FRTRDSSFAQDPREQIAADVRRVGIWDAHRRRSPDHDLMPRAHERALEAELRQTANEVNPTDRADRRHYTASLTLRSIPFATGKVMFLRSRIRIQSSRTSLNSSRQASSVSALAQTPWKPGIRPKNVPSSSRVSNCARSIAAR